MTAPPDTGFTAALPSGRFAALGAHYPVVIVGGGVNGAGLYRELSLQGVDCLLVDRDDWGAGTSAASSRLIHGGIKYLETGEIRLVRQSTLERNLLLRNAPHCVAPIETVLPIRTVFGGVVPSIRRVLGGRARLADRGLLVTATGVALFDWFGRRHRVLPRARVWLRRRLRRECPGLAPGINAAAVYHDAKVVAAERLVLELVLDGTTANARSTALNHVALAGVEQGRLVLEEARTGERRTVAADIVVNAGGAAIDLVNRRLGLETAHVGGQKGSHLVVDHPRLRAALGDRMVYFGASDGRVALLYPFGPHVLVGSTDIPVAEDHDPVCEDAERDYMIGVVREVFPALPIHPDDVVYSYAGVRPLPRSTASDPGAVSRDHVVRTDRLPGDATPVLSLVGGKWTTFRGFADEVATDILRRLDRPRRLDTRHVPIGGGRDFPRDAAARARTVAAIVAEGVDAARADALLRRYGTRAAAVAAFSAARDDAPLRTVPRFTRAEIGFIAANEAVVRLADIVFRRTDIALSGELTRPVVTEIAGIVAAALGWDDDTTRAEITAVRDHAIARHGLTRANYENGGRTVQTGDVG